MSPADRGNSSHMAFPALEIGVSELVETIPLGRIHPGLCFGGWGVTRAV